MDTLVSNLVEHFNKILDETCEAWLDIIKHICI